MNNKAVLTCPETGEDITVSFREFTPQQAARLLDNNHPRNRNVKDAVVNNYAKQMRDGLWHPASGEAIKLSTINTDGRPREILVDGQHRLHGVIKSNTPTTFMTITGVPECAFAAIDDGVNRDLAAVMTINGVQFAGSMQRVSACLKTMYMFSLAPKKMSNLRSRKHKFSSNEMLKYYGQLDFFSEAMAAFHHKFKYSKLTKNFNPPAAMMCYYLIKGIDEKTDEALFTVTQSLESGTPFDGLLDKSPSHLVMSYIREKRAINAPLRSHDYIKMFYWAVEQTLSGKPLSSKKGMLEWNFDPANNPLHKRIIDRCVKNG